MSTEMRIDERGSIYVLAIFVVISILATLALFIDGSIGYISRQQYDGAATQAALGALETYINRPDSELNPLKLGHARARAEELLSNAIGGNAISKNLVNDSGHSLRFPFSLSFANPVVAHLSDPMDVGRNGNIWHGIWHFSDPGPFHPVNNPDGFDGCGHDAAFKPCFQAFGAGDENKPGNAIQIETRLSGDSLMKTFFARTGIMNIERTSVATRKGSALIPRVMFFLPDITSTSVQYSHLNRYQGTRQMQYTFPLVTGCPTLGSPLTADRVLNNYGLRQIFLSLETNFPTRPNGDTNANNFYADDYKCITVPANLECDARSYYIDAPPAGVNRAPQPLSDILASMHSSLIDLETRATQSDRVGMLAWDSRDPLKCRGSLNLGNPLELALLNKLDADYNGIKDATILSSSTRVDRMLFPRQVNLANNSVRTDLGLALKQAEQVITAKYPDYNAASAAQFDLIVYSDGEANCYRETKLGGPTCSATSESGLEPDLDGTGTKRRCCSIMNTKINNVPSHLVWGIDDVVEQFDEATDRLIEYRVALNMVLFSTAVHTVVRTKGGGGGCMSEAEISSEDLNLTDWGDANDAWEADPLTFNPLDPNNPASVAERRYWYVNKLWKAVDRSGGLWLVVRPPCGGSVTANQLQVNTACTNTATPNAPVNLYAAFGCNGGSPCSAVAGGGTYCPYNPGTDPEICQYIDEQGRLLCDLENRSKQTQFQEFIRELTKTNPFKPVEVSL